EDDYLELASISDRAAYLAASPGGGLADFLARGGGFRYVILQSDDLAADVRAMQGRGVEVNEPTDGSRRTPAGQVLRWKLAVLGRGNPLPLLFIQHLTPFRPTPEPGAQNRPRVHRGAGSRGRDPAVQPRPRHAHAGGAAGGGDQGGHGGIRSGADGAHHRPAGRARSRRRGPPPPRARA